MRIRVYSSSSYFEIKNTLVDNESFFKNNVGPKQLTQLSTEAMREIDNAVLLDRNTGKIETPFGICSIRDLSTGCKTVLNAIYLMENPDEYPQVMAIDATESGYNAIDKLFEILEANEFDIGVIIEHNDDLFRCKERQYLFDDVVEATSMLMFG